MAEQAAQGADDLPVGELSRLASEVETAFLQCQSSIAAVYTLYNYHRDTEPGPDPQPPPNANAGRAAADKMGAVFGQLRTRVQQLSQHNRGGRADAARAEAAAIAAIAADRGLRGLALHAARAAEGSGYMPRGGLDELERHLDTAEAMWLGGCLACSFKSPQAPGRKAS
jgi:hypothetical protein